MWAISRSIYRGWSIEQIDRCILLDDPPFPLADSPTLPKNINQMPCVDFFQGWIFFRGEYFSGVNLFQGWIFFRGWIFLGWIFGYSTIYSLRLRDSRDSQDSETPEAFVILLFNFPLFQIYNKTPRLPKLHQEVSKFWAKLQFFWFSPLWLFNGFPMTLLPEHKKSH